MVKLRLTEDEVEIWKRLEKNAPRYLNDLERNGYVQFGDEEHFYELRGRKIPKELKRIFFRAFGADKSVGVSIDWSDTRLVFSETAQERLRLYREAIRNEDYDIAKPLVAQVVKPEDARKSKDKYRQTYEKPKADHLTWDKETPWIIGANNLERESSSLLIET